MNKKDILAFLSSYKDEFKIQYGVTRIGLFGSYARGNESNDSDIDIAVEIESFNKFRSFFGLKRELEKGLGRKVDLGIESSLKPITKKYILKEILYV
ncbi:nucleotidyltransferase family protein [uncultured Desulfobacter sp.]|uniref:nucleotidyltransferase family protein n=1 Tax=uncultured Desulfobacter sp. TaxID=240139 RepID=UPI0029F49494|nr:nucleotidyltransferase family protein [uncultured Desulfobacter sp.]